MDFIRLSNMFAEIIKLNRIALRNWRQTSFALTHIKTYSAAVPATAKGDEAEPEKRPIFLDDGEETAINPERYNKSRLQNRHRNMLHDRLPSMEPQHWCHLTEKYQRKMLGRYGAASGVDPRICFNTKSAEAQQKMYERIAHPHTLPEMIAKVRTERSQKQEQVRQREEDISKKLLKLEQWKHELNAKIAKKEAATLAAKERKERLVEEVRRHFGFKLDPRDERFKEMLEQKEREDKKKQRDAKRKAKEEKMMAKLFEKSSEI